ncbi:hypothetical protein [Enterococcus faecium]|uniref:hypothetical protein n=1 Tax=Enterococcus faecium TaxID=1352 RepID=UPI0025AEFEF5|nr:hypothetical protein [Enterococcus faecium]MDN3079855.1 hypothetical protein [Enterococcus faecium]
MQKIKYIWFGTVTLNGKEQIVNENKSTAATVSGEFSLNTQDHKFAEVTKASAKSHPLEELDTAMKLNSKLKLAKDLASKSYLMNLVWTLIADPK